MKRNFKDKFKRIALAGALAMGIGFMFYRIVEGESKVLKPYTLIDVTNDGVEDAVLISPNLMDSNFDILGYIDGQNLVKDSNGQLYRDQFDNIYSRGLETPLFGEVIEKPKNFTTGRIIAVGNYNNNPMLDVKVIDRTSEVPVTIDQYLYDVFPAPNEVKAEKE